MITIQQRSGTIKAYRSDPPGAHKYGGAVLLVHELWGLTDQIKGVADRIAAQGYLVLAPDMFSTDQTNRQPSDQLERELFSPDEHVRYAAMPKLRAMIAPTQTTQFKLLALSRLSSCFEYLYNQPLAHQKVTIVGFGLGGTYAFEFAMHEQRLRGVVIFYAHAPSAVVELRRITCPVLAFYGKKETSLYDELLHVMDRVGQTKLNFQPIVYEESGHGFFNEKNILAYHPKTAADAWRRMMDFVLERNSVPILPEYGY